MHSNFSAFLFQLSLALSLAFCPGKLWSQQSPIALTDLLRIRQPVALRISPEGDFVYCSVTEIIPDKEKANEWRYETQLWRVATNQEGVAEKLTNAPEGISGSSISPDGSQLAFCRNIKGKSQLFVMDLPRGDARQLTQAEQDATKPFWSPDGKKIYFYSSYSLDALYRSKTLNAEAKLPPWSSERPGLPDSIWLGKAGAAPDPDGDMPALRAWLAQNEKDGKAKRINKLRFQEESTTSGQYFFPQLFSIELKGKNLPSPVVTGFFGVEAAIPMDQGGSLLIEAPHNMAEMPDRVQGETAFYIAHPGKPLRHLLGQKDSAYHQACLSPSGRWLAFTRGSNQFSASPYLCLWNMKDPDAKPFVIDFDRSPANLTWSEDEKALFFTANTNGGNLLYRYELATKSVTALTPAGEGVGSPLIHKDLVVFVKTSAANPFELYAADTSGKNARRISQFNHSWLQQRQLAVPEKRTFINNKGLSVDYWVMLPPGTSGKVPTILEIHGGPSAMWGPGESSMWHEFQYYCAKGYAVVYSNPRGSGGYGRNFLQANVGDWGEGPMKDVLTALELSAGEFSQIDTSRLAVTGGSYAGYLIGYMLGHDHRFKVACAQRGVYDLRTFFGEGNAWKLIPGYFGGYPWDTATYRMLEAQSPINYVDRVTTPLIIFHGENDLRTGVIQSEQFYKSLKVLGRPVEYVRHPGATHEITRSGNNRQRMDQLLRTFEFFERFISH